jgi:hypothetical protein
VCTKLALFTRLHRDALSTKHKKPRHIISWTNIRTLQHGRFRRHALFLQKTHEIYIKPRSVVAATLSLQCSLTFNCNLLHTHMKATQCRCKSLMLHKHTTSFLPKVRPLMGKRCPSFRRTNALIQDGNNFSAYDYVIQLPFPLLQFLCSPTTIASRPIVSISLLVLQTYIIFAEQKRSESQASFAFGIFNKMECQSQWPRGLRRRSAVARLLRSWVRIPLGACMDGCCECCVLSGRGLCEELTTRPEESYRLW